MEEKKYTQAEVDTLINNVRIEERYIANQIMGNLGIPVNARLSPDGRPIYAEAANIVMSLILSPKKVQGVEPPKDDSVDAQ